MTIIRFAPVLYVFLIGAVVVFWGQLDGLLYPADVFPRIILLVVGATSMLALAQEVWDPTRPPIVTRRFVFSCSVAASAVLYIWLISMIGYYVASAAYLMVLYPAVNMIKDGSPLSKKLIINSIIATLLVTISIYIVFTVLLKINVPMLIDHGPV